ncbi:E3 ubiquitin-protein ligase KEG-like [Carya illinoinensis]|uniref:RING-type E3 ubiquitin transferase n=1 Tax=Carya illinoinensis TaxID=32201 RepID=A0A8T1NHF0_CARIL|nr:E3 ubiquitin-protein ligase KEG-like [Carya illinoinensis]KAG6629825.1 hypothetical protein CIPAW_14G112000 [Carya illinoinensis]
MRKNSPSNSKKKIRIPSCLICQTPYDEDSHAPLLLQCGHCFCKICLSRIVPPSSSSSSSSYSAPPKPTLLCPKCRHPSTVGNSVLSLPKNYSLFPILSDEDDLSEEEDDGSESESAPPLPRSPRCRSGGTGLGRSLCLDHEMRLIKRIGEGAGGVRAERWSGELRALRCRHKVMVKLVEIGDVADSDWVEGELEKLRLSSTWCRNVCAFHGVVKQGDRLCLVMERCYGSVQSEMRRSGGRLTLEQILRYGADIARGVAELHAAGVVCMNLKPSNFVLDSNGCAVVSDYGLPIILKKPSCRKARPGPEADCSKMHWCIDCTSLSPHYTAPETWEPLKKPLHLFRDDVNYISAASDAWSFGCALVEMCTGSIPWDGLSADEIYRAVVKDGRPPLQYSSVVGVGIPRDLWKMIGECLQCKSSRRPNFNAMLAIFLRHLQRIPHSPTSSNNELANGSGIDLLERSPTSVLDISLLKSNYLHQLVSEGNLNGVRDLLAKSALGNNSSSIISLLEAHNAEGQTALHLACRRGCPEIVDAILEYGSVDVDVPDENGNPPIVFALAVGSSECVRALIRKSANVLSRSMEGLGRSAAHICAFYGQPVCMRELLLAGADPTAVDADGETILHIAVAKKFTECAIVVLENGGCKSMGVLSSKDLTPLHLCISTLNVAIVKRWAEIASPKEISEAIDIPSSAGTALCMAAAIKKDRETEGRELVRILLAAGASPTAQDTQQFRTALHTAAMANDVELVKIILDAGVDVNIRNVNNTIPLHLALAKGAKPCVELLLSAGADCNMQDDDGDNAFHIAADAAKYIRECLECIVVMLQYPGAALEVRNHSGKTLRDLLEALPREWISEDLMEALMRKGLHLSPTIFEVGDWVKFKRSVTTPVNGWRGARHGSVGFVQSVQDGNILVVSFCTGVARVLVNEVIKVIPLDRGQLVQLKAAIEKPRYDLRGQSRDSIGTVLCIDDDDGIIRIGFTGASRGWQADPADFERVEQFKVGDWVRVCHNLHTAKHGFGAVIPGSIGIVYGIRPDCSLLIEFSYLPSPWLCEPEELEPFIPFRIGDQVCVKRSVSEPRFPWDGETHHSVGKISDIESNGLLIIDIPKRHIPWRADPSDMEKVENFKVGDWVRVKASVPSPKYGWEDVTRDSIGIIHSLVEDGDMAISFCFRSKTFSCSMTDMEKVSPFQAGEEIRVMPSINEPLLGWSNETPSTSGKITRIDMDGTLNVRVAGRVSLWKVAPGDAERLSGLAVGDWVRLKQCMGTRPVYEWNTVGKDNKFNSSIAVVHSLQDYSYLELVSCFRKGKFIAHCTEVEKVAQIKIGQHVRFRAGLTEPRWGWRDACPSSRGVVTAVSANGEIRVSFFNLSAYWRGDPADFEVEEMFEVGEWVRLNNDATEWKSLQPGSIGVVQGIGYKGDGWDGTILVGFCGESELWTGHVSELERVDRFATGQRVRVKSTIKDPRFGWSGYTHASIVSLTAVDADGKLRTYTPNVLKAWMLDPSEVELVEEEMLKVGDWVRVKSSVVTPVYHWGEVTPKSVGVVHRLEEGELWLSFCFMESLWICKEYEVERTRAFEVGDMVRFREGLVTPRWGWGMETHASRGQVVGVDANGKLRVKFKWREGRPWIGDPADIVLDEFL